MVPDVIVDQLIGTGCLERLVFSWAGNPGVGSLHRFRDAVERDWPGPLELDEHTHAGLASRLVAGASGLPFAVLRAYSGTDLLAQSQTVREIDCPFSGTRLAAVAALNPEVAIVHAQRADHHGNIQLWGITGVPKEAVLCAKRSLVTVEEVVDELTPLPGAIVIPSWVVTYAAAVPGGSYPTYSQGSSSRANEFFVEWDAISRDRDVFLEWVREHVLTRNAESARISSRSQL